MTTTTTPDPLLPPPRLSGNSTQDIQVIQRWVNDLYDAMFKTQNILGTVADLQARVTKLEAQVATLNTHDGI